jgi:hypothetical protein
VVGLLSFSFVFTTVGTVLDLRFGSTATRISGGCSVYVHLPPIYPIGKPNDLRFVSLAEVSLFVSLGVHDELRATPPHVLP